MVNQFRWSTCT